MYHSSNEELHVLIGNPRKWEFLSTGRGYQKENIACKDDLIGKEQHPPRSLD